jgi:glycosyltransferase involved in cell wall biosynthesis
VHAYWAVRITNILRKKSVVVIGGYEVAKIPELRYGLLLNPKSESCVKFILSNATQMLTVDDGLKKDAIMNTGLNDLNIQTVPTGYDFTRFFPSGEKEKMILTVCSFDTWERAQLKGVNTFVKCANFFPSYTFLIIGAQDKAVKQISKIAPENVKVIGLIPNEELVHYYQKAKVYCQLSMREGLPNSLCEAMLCECVPVGTDIPGIRSAIGDTGYYVPYGNIDSTVDALQKALRSEKGNLARERIVNNFPLEKREKRLKQIINSLIPSIN